MKTRIFNSLALGSLLACSQQLLAQVIPDIGNTVQDAVQNAVERQVEQAQNAALERTVAQAEAAAANQALERAEAVQADIVQNQALEQVQNQVERVQTQATEQAQSTVERVQAQIDTAQSQVEQAQAQLDPLPDNQAPTRQVVTAADGSTAFVEITLEPGVRAVEFEWVMIVTPEERAQLDAQATELLTYLTDTEPFALAEDGELLTFTVPPDLDANDAILDLVPDNMRDLIDRNHIYDTQDDDSTNAATSDSVQLPLPMPAVCEEPIKIGMIDSAIDAMHPAFGATAQSIHQRSFVDAELSQPSTHGTSVAGLLIGRDASEQSGVSLRPLLPTATLYSAAVFHEQEGVQPGATVMRVLSALDWLLEQDDIRVINMSLAGPPNRLLARAVTAATAQGKLIVAAAGNDGPFGPVRYPAAYADAIGVTAVARDRGIFRFANQGAHIDYAALGVEVPTAIGNGGFGAESGTSLAAPIVAAFIACELAQHGDAQQALAALDARVLDLGAPGSDPVFGRGLLHP